MILTDLVAMIFRLAEVGLPSPLDSHSHTHLDTDTHTLSLCTVGLRSHRRWYNRKPPACQPRAVLLVSRPLHLCRGRRRPLHPAGPPLAAPLLR